MLGHHSAAHWRGGYHQDNIQLIMFLLAHPAQNEEQFTFLMADTGRKKHFYFSIKLIWHQSPSAESDNTALERAFPICCQRVVVQSDLVVSCRKVLVSLPIAFGYLTQEILETTTCGEIKWRLCWFQTHAAAWKCFNQWTGLNLLQGVSKMLQGCLFTLFLKVHVGQILYKIALCLLLMGTWIWPAPSELTRSRWNGVSRTIRVSG